MEYYLFNNPQEYDEFISEHNFEPNAQNGQEPKRPRAETGSISKPDYKVILISDKDSLSKDEWGNFENKAQTKNLTDPESVDLFEAQRNEVKANPIFPLLEKKAQTKNLTVDELDDEITLALNEFKTQGRSGNPFTFVTNWLENLKVRYKFEPKTPKPWEKAKELEANYQQNRQHDDEKVETVETIEVIQFTGENVEDFEARCEERKAKFKAFECKKVYCWQQPDDPSYQPPPPRAVMPSLAELKRQIAAKVTANYD